MLSIIDSFTIPVQPVEKTVAGETVTFLLCDAPDVFDATTYPHSIEARIRESFLKFDSDMRTVFDYDGGLILHVSPHEYRYALGHSTPHDYTVQGNRELVEILYPQFLTESSDTPPLFDCVMLGNWDKDNSCVHMDILTSESEPEMVYMFCYGISDDYTMDHYISPEWSLPITVDNKTVMMTDKDQAQYAVNTLNSLSESAYYQAEGDSHCRTDRQYVEYTMIPIPLGDMCVPRDGIWDAEEFISVIADMHHKAWCTGVMNN